jgi:BirA family biotin operon repressor/biotin-[acetyl-CoA-carboxylase] ligase
LRFQHFADIDSTNAEAMRQAEAGASLPIWISADLQTGGKGRRGREWVSKKGNLYCTGMYSHSGDLASAAKLSFVAALAVADTLAHYIDTDLIQIKWPNDVLVDGKKISGILLESGTSKSGVIVAIGIGINLVNHPKDTETAATHMLEHVPFEKLNNPEPVFTGPEPVMALLAARFEHWRDIYLNEGFASIRSAWTARAVGINQTVSARLSNRTITGTAMGLDNDGALILETPTGAIEKIHAGDVFFPQTDL